MKPILWKELRENVRWLPAGLLVIGSACWLAHPDLHNPSGLLANVLLTQLAIVTPLLAFALGIVQSYRDLQPGAAAYLNHRGITSSQIFLAKTVAGFALYAISVIIPVVILAAWVWYEGMSRYPMRPAQVVPSLVFAMAAFAMHPAAMLMMSRSASWWETRVFPLLPAAGVLFVFFHVLKGGGLSMSATSTWLTLILLAWLIATSRQSWRDSITASPSAHTNSRLRGRWLLPSYLFISAAVCYSFVLTLCFTILEVNQRSREYVPRPFAQLAVNQQTGEPWVVTYLQDHRLQSGGYAERAIGGSAIRNGGTVDALKKLNINDEFTRFASMVRLQNTYRQSDGFFAGPSNLDQSSTWYFYDTRGYLVGYDLSIGSRWSHTIATDGIHRAGTIAGVPFTSDPEIGSSVFSDFRSAGYSVPLIDGHGVYVLDGSLESIQQIIDQPIDSAALVSIGRSRAPRLLLRDGNEILEYEFVDESGADTWYKEPGDVERMQSYNILQPLTAGSITPKRVNTYTVPQSLVPSVNLQVGLADNVLYLSTHTFRTKEIYRIPAEGDFVAINFQSQSLPIQETDVDRFQWIFVCLGLTLGALGVVIAGLATWGTLVGGNSSPTWNSLLSYPIQFTTLATSFALVTVIAVWITRRVSFQRGLSRKQTTLWSVSALLLSLIAPLAILAIYRRVHRRGCDHCGKQRRVDMLACEHCGADWQRPIQNEVLILDDAA